MAGTTTRTTASPTVSRGSDQRHPRMREKTENEEWKTAGKNRKAGGQKEENKG
jgi:hypothetical protein